MYCILPAKLEIQGRNNNSWTTFLQNFPDMSENSTEMRLKSRIPAMMVLTKLQIKWPLLSGSWITIGMSVQVHWNQTTTPPKKLQKQTSLDANVHMATMAKLIIQLCCQPEPLHWWIKWCFSLTASGLSGLHLQNEWLNVLSLEAFYTDLKKTPKHSVT